MAAKQAAKDISNPSNILSGKREALDLEYVAWGCACANWVTPTDRMRYQENRLAEHCIFIEPAGKSLSVPIYFDTERHFIKVEGQFYMKPGYPKGTIQGEEKLAKAKVFRYENIEVREKQINYLPKDDTTLTLSYGAIACPCAQWIDSKLRLDSARVYYFLEPATKKLVNANTLWNGNNIPLQVQVTGQIVSYAGYPTGYNIERDGTKAERVFRYTRIKVLKNGHK